MGLDWSLCLNYECGAATKKPRGVEGILAKSAQMLVLDKHSLLFASQDLKNPKLLVSK